MGPLIVTVAAASDNYIYGMEGQPGGPIHLNLGSGEALTLKGCGSLTNPSNDFRCWWSDPFNQVVIGSGGVLTLDESYLIVATQNASGNVGNFEIRDGGKVELRTGETTLSVDYLKVVNGGVLDLGPATSLTGPTNEGVRQLDLSAAEIIGQQGAQAALRSLNVSGTSDVTLDSLADIRANYLSLGDATTRLNILRAGSGSDPATLSLHEQSRQSGAGLVTAGGDIYVAPGATLGFGDPRVFDTPEPAYIGLINGAATPSIIRVDAGATASLFANATLALDDSDTNPPIFDVHGDFWLEGEFLGVPSGISRYTIEDTSDAGTGQVTVGLGGTIEAGEGGTLATLQRTLEIQPALRLYYGSTMAVQLLPIAGFSNTIEVGGEFFLGEADPYAVPDGQFSGYPSLRIDLAPQVDATLPLGTKFVLFDYDPNHPPSGLGWFKGFGEGYTFTKGLNQYQIRYSDPEYGAVNGGNDSVITLTVVSREVLDDVYTATENSVLVEVAPGVLANDPVYINTGGGLPQLSSQPAHGTVEMYSDGGFVYTPAPDFVGLDTFEYVVLDGPFTSEPAVVWIEVLPGAPAAIPVAVPALSRFGLLVLAVLALGLGLVGVRRMI